MRPIVGVHFGDPHRKGGYPVPTAFTEHVYTHPFNVADEGSRERQERHWQEVGEWCEILTAAGHLVLLKIKYHHHCDQPCDKSQINEYVRALEDMAPYFNSAVRVCFGNEPNWFSLDGYDPSISPCLTSEVMREGIKAWQKKHSRAQCYITPIAPYAAREGRRVAPDFDTGIENSPWARYATELYNTLERNGAETHGVVLHAYGRVGPRGRANGGHLEPWLGAHNDQGQRWGTNVLQTWRECLDATGLGALPVWIAEINTRTDGQSCHSYPRGYMQQAYAYACSVFPNDLEALCWFVDQDPGGWSDEALSAGQGCLRDANRDLKRLWGQR